MRAPGRRAEASTACSVAAAPRGRGRLATPQVGLANGLAWTEGGGEVLRVEVAETPGRGLVLPVSSATS